MKFYYLLGLMLLTSGGILALAGTFDKDKGQMPENTTITAKYSQNSSLLVGTKLFSQNRCGGCHSDADPNPEFDPIMPTPKIAGQSKNYLIKILTDFRDGKLKGSMMPSIAKTLDDNKINHLAEWLSSLPKSTLKNPGKYRPPILNGDKKRLIQPCESCHGLNGKGTASAPAIAGQNPDYFYDQLKAFADGSRPNDLYGGMARIAKGLTEEEIQALTAYFTQP